MKRLLIIIIFISAFSHDNFGQWQWEINFEDWYYGEDRVYIDSVSNPNNIWQIGQPSKILFNEAYSNPNAIVTDTLNNYPSNDTSKFIIKHFREVGPQFYNISIAFMYRINSDTLVDYGTVETSFDSGETWIDLLDDYNITFYNLFWLYGKPVLSGNIDEWQEVYLWLGEINNYFEFNDTILYRFTFISDNIDNQKEGWIIDDIRLEDWYEDIEYIENRFKSSIYPNPVANIGILKFENEERENCIVEIFNTTGKIVKSIQTVSNEISIQNSEFNKGTYFYRISKFKERSFGKFIIN